MEMCATVGMLHVEHKGTYPMQNQVETRTNTRRLDYRFEPRECRCCLTSYNNKLAAL